LQDGVAVFSDTGVEAEGFLAESFVGNSFFPEKTRDKTQPNASEAERFGALWAQIASG
jgi:hypothetical protein